MNEKTLMIASKSKEAVSFENLNIEALKQNNKEKFSSLLMNNEFRKAKIFREQVKIALIMLRSEDDSQGRNEWFLDDFLEIQRSCSFNVFYMSLFDI